jgi:ABC-type transporter Mla MlaB component
VVLDLESVTDIDPTASDALAEVVATLQGRDTVIALARASTEVRALLEQYGITASLGPDALYESNREALAAFRAQDADAGPS